MKKNLPLIPLLLVLMIPFYSCSISKNTVTDRQADTQNSLQTPSACFVQMKDGSVVNYNSLKLMTAVFNDAYLLADGKTRIYPKEIRAYQTTKYYAVSQTVFTGVRQSHIAVDCLPGFAIRIAKGQINLYCKKYYNGSHAVDEFFVQAGEDGEVLAYSPEVMNELLKNYVEAVGFFKKKIKGSELSKKLLALVNIVNNDPLITKN